MADQLQQVTASISLSKYLVRKCCGNKQTLNFSNAARTYVCGHLQVLPIISKMAPRSFATEFLLRELLAALGASPEASAGADSLSESMSEDTESQAAAPLGSQPRVMLVRRTNSSRQTVTLVDRQYDVEAFIPSHVRDALRKDFDYQTIGRLSGSVVRVTKYHFATLERCLATDQAQQTSRSAPHMGQGKARVYLWVDALAIVQDSELAVNTLPDVYSHPLVVEKLQALTDAELEKQLMIHQGLPPIGTESDRFDDERPLLEEDCVIPEDQEQALEQQDEWGPPERQPTDSELIEENGNVSMTESQVMRVVVTSPEKGTQDSVLTAASSGNSSVTLSGNPSVSVSDEASFKSSPGSQKLQFQQENIRETFVVGSDVESEAEEEDDSEQKSEKATPRPPTSQRGRRSERRQSLAPSSPAPTPSQDSWMVVDLTADTPEKAPQAAAVDEKQAQKDTTMQLRLLRGLSSQARPRRNIKKTSSRGSSSSFPLAPLMALSHLLVRRVIPLSRTSLLRPRSSTSRRKRRQKTRRKRRTGRASVAQLRSSCLPRRRWCWTLTTTRMRTLSSTKACLRATWRPPERWCLTTTIARMITHRHRKQTRLTT